MTLTSGLMPGRGVPPAAGSASTRPAALYTKTCSNTELRRLPSTAGRSTAGTRLTSAIQLSETTPATAAAGTSAASRRRGRPQPATSQASPSAGRISQACTILAWNASPTQTPASTRCRTREVSSALTVALTAQTDSKIMSESEMLPRLRAMAAGVTVPTAAATMPATGPASRRTAR